MRQLPPNAGISTSAVIKNTRRSASAVTKCRNNNQLIPNAEINASVVNHTGIVVLLVDNCNFFARKCTLTTAIALAV